MNNGVVPPVDPSPARIINNQQSKPLEGNHGERLDARGAGAGRGVDPQLEAVGVRHGAEND